MYHHSGAGTVHPGGEETRELRFHAPPHASASDAAWAKERRATLLEWGTKRDANMHRRPACLMDQMISGSNLYPLHLLDEQEWLTERERGILGRVTEILAPVGQHADKLAIDVMAPLIYDLDVRVILDNSGSMGWDMMGNMVGARNGFGTNANASVPWVDQQSGQFSMRFAKGRAVTSGAVANFSRREDALAFLYDQRTPACCCGNCLLRNPTALMRLLPGYRPLDPVQVQQHAAPIDPRHRRWHFAKDHLNKWYKVWRTMGLDPPLYLLNQSRGLPKRMEHADLDAVFERHPSGRTALTQTLQDVLSDHKRDNAARAAEDRRMLQVIIVTDGEANFPAAFNGLLDGIQNKAHGDVQVCLMGLSLVPEDIEWFEDEECDDTHIRTIEAFEVEQQQMLRREVITKEGEYNFDMHVYRTLVTNLFPADYDYEAPWQNLRHRCYATCHSRDRWYMQKSCPVNANGQIQCSGCDCGCYKCVSGCVGGAVCTALFCGTGCCCCGYLQGEDCFHCRTTECCDTCCSGGGD